MGEFAPVYQGQQWHPSATEVNAMLEAGARVRHAGRLREPRDFRHARGCVEVDVLNASGGDLDVAYPVLARDGLAGDPADLVDTIHQRPILRGITPTDQTPASELLILSDPARDGEVAKAVLVGVASVVVDYTDESKAHQYARPINGDATKLTSGATGLLILEREKQSETGAATTGVQWARVLVGGAAAQANNLTHFAIVTVAAAANGGTVGKAVLLDDDMAPTVVVDPLAPGYDALAVAAAEIEFKCAHETLACPVNRRVTLSGAEDLTPGSVFADRKVWALLTDQVVYALKTFVTDIQCDPETGLSFDDETLDVALKPPTA